MTTWLAGARVLTDDLPHLEFSAPRYLLAATQGRVAERLFGSDGLPLLTGGGDGVLEQRFLATAREAKTRARLLRRAWDARQRGDAAAAVAALRGVLEAAPEDLRAIQAAGAEVRTLAGTGVPLADLQARLDEIAEGSWPFTRHAPWPMAEALAYAGRKLVDEGGDLEEATGHLLRAWLRSPEDGRTIYDLARAYAARGDRGRALDLLARAREAGFAVGESAREEPFFDPFRDDPSLP